MAGDAEARGFPLEVPGWPPLCTGMATAYVCERGYTGVYTPPRDKGMPYRVWRIIAAGAREAPDTG